MNSAYAARVCLVWILICVCSAPVAAQPSLEARLEIGDMHLVGNHLRVLVCTIPNELSSGGRGVVESTTVLQLADDRQQGGIADERFGRDFASWENVLSFGPVVRMYDNGEIVRYSMQPNSETPVIESFETNASGSHWRTTGVYGVTPELISFSEPHIYFSKSKRYALRQLDDSCALYDLRDGKVIPDEWLTRDFWQMKDRPLPYRVQMTDDLEWIVIEPADEVSEPDDADGMQPSIGCYVMQRGTTTLVPCKIPRKREVGELTRAYSNEGRLFTTHRVSDRDRLAFTEVVCDRDGNVLHRFDAPTGFGSLMRESYDATTNRIVMLNVGDVAGDADRDQGLHTYIQAFICDCTTGRSHNVTIQLAELLEERKGHLVPRDNLQDPVSLEITRPVGVIRHWVRHGNQIRLLVETGSLVVPAVDKRAYYLVDVQLSADACQPKAVTVRGPIFLPKGPMPLYKYWSEDRHEKWKPPDLVFELLHDSSLIAFEPGDRFKPRNAWKLVESPLPKWEALTYGAIPKVLDYLEAESVRRQAGPYRLFYGKHDCLLFRVSDGKWVKDSWLDRTYASLLTEDIKLVFNARTVALDPDWNSLAMYCRFSDGDPVFWNGKFITDGESLVLVDRDSKGPTVYKLPETNARKMNFLALVPWQGELLALDAMYREGLDGLVLANSEGEVKFELAGIEGEGRFVGQNSLFIPRDQSAVELLRVRDPQDIELHFPWQNEALHVLRWNFSEDSVCRYSIWLKDIFQERDGILVPIASEEMPVLQGSHAEK